MIKSVLVLGHADDPPLPEGTNMVRMNASQVPRLEAQGYAFDAVYTDNLADVALVWPILVNVDGIVVLHKRAATPQQKREMGDG